MSSKVLILTEAPEGHYLNRDVEEYVFPEIDGIDFDHLSVTEDGPRNGKKATKTELKAAIEIAEVAKDYDVVMIVGNTPLQLITGSAGISKMRGKPLTIDGTIYLPINNPGIIRHDPHQELILEQDLTLFRQLAETGLIPRAKGLSTKVVMTWADFDNFLEDLDGAVSYDIETNTLNPFQTHVMRKGQRIEEPAKIITIGFGTAQHQWIIPIKHHESPWSDDDIELMVDRITEKLDDVSLITHNGKFDMLFTWVHLGVKWEIAFDTMLAHYLIDENMRHGLKYLAQVYCQAPDWEVDLDTKQGNKPLDQLIVYHAHDLYYTRKLRYIFGKMLVKEPEVREVFNRIMVPIANLFIEIEYDGVYIDVDKFSDAEEYLREQYASALQDLSKWEPNDCVDSKGRPTSFNWGSTKQLGELLYDRLKLPVIERTAAGGRSCSESVIKRLDHPCTSALLKFREAKQQLSFFIDGWRPFLHKRGDGYYLHPSFKLHGTVTGRLSCENPNLQQVPRDKRIRTIITAPKGWTLIECDLSQIELRIAAELAGESNMIYAFTHGIDVHWLTGIREIARGGGLKRQVIDTASILLQRKNVTYSEAIEALLKAGPDAAIEVDPEWKELRKKAKAINFGYLYGMWWPKFKDYARDNYGVSMTDKQAEASRELFFDNYPNLEPWHKAQKAFARRNGYVMSLSGRKRRLPAALSRDATPERKAAERQAINSPVQSFANELNLMAALQLRKEYGRDVVRICGTVHDAVLFRVRDSHVAEVYTRMLEIMTGPELMKEMGIELSVPVEADGSIGPWGAGVTLEKWNAQRQSK